MCTTSCEKHDAKKSLEGPTWRNSYDLPAYPNATWEFVFHDKETCTKNIYYLQNSPEPAYTYTATYKVDKVGATKELQMIFVYSNGQDFIPIEDNKLVDYYKVE
jgi:hypothetical protein